MGDKIKLKRIVLKTSEGKEVSLTLEEAKELSDQLSELFGPKYIPYQPVVIDRYYPPWDRYYKPYITWTSGAACGTDLYSSPNTGMSLSYTGSPLNERIDNALSR